MGISNKRVSIINSQPPNFLILTKIFFKNISLYLITEIKQFIETTISA